MKIIIPNRQSFYTFDKNIRIYDNRGIEFYFYDWNNKKYHLFNLPKGTYYTENKIYKSPQQFFYTEAELPPPENDAYLKISKVYLIPETNHRKGSIVIDPIKKYARISYDYRLDKLPYYCKDFVIGHELGHLRYISEDLCDRYSRNLLTSLGYNPSQLNKAIKQTLEFRNFETEHRIEISKYDNKNYKPVYL